MEPELRKQRKHEHNGTVRDCPHCEERLRMAAVTVKEQNAELTREFEIVDKHFARRRALKRRDSPDPEEQQSESSDDGATKQKEAAYKQSQEQRREKHRKKTRAHKAVRRKKRIVNPEPRVPYQPPLKKENKKEAQKEIDVTELRKAKKKNRPAAPPADTKELEQHIKDTRTLPKDAPTFYNRVKHSIRAVTPDDADTAARRKGTYSKLCHRTFHLYASQKELPPSGRFVVHLDPYPDFKKYKVVKCKNRGSTKSYYAMQMQDETKKQRREREEKEHKFTRGAKYEAQLEKYQDGMMANKDRYLVVTKGRCDIVTEYSGQKSAEDLARLGTVAKGKQAKLDSDEELLEYERYTK